VYIHFIPPSLKNHSLQSLIIFHLKIKNLPHVMGRALKAAASSPSGKEIYYFINAYYVFMLCSLRGKST